MIPDCFDELTFADVRRRTWDDLDATSRRDSMDDEDDDSGVSDDDDDEAVAAPADASVDDGPVMMSSAMGRVRMGRRGIWWDMFMMSLQRHEYTSTRLPMSVMLTLRK